MLLICPLYPSSTPTSTRVARASLNRRWRAPAQAARRRRRLGEARLGPLTWRVLAGAGNGAAPHAASRQNLPTFLWGQVATGGRRPGWPLPAWATGHGGECGVRGPGTARRLNLHVSEITSCMRRIICQFRYPDGSLSRCRARARAGGRVAVWPHANLCRTVTGGARRGTREARAAESCPPSVFFYLERYFAI